MHDCTWCEVALDPAERVQGAERQKTGRKRRDRLDPIQSSRLACGAGRRPATHPGSAPGPRAPADRAPHDRRPAGPRAPQSIAIHLRAEPGWPGRSRPVPEAPASGPRPWRAPLEPSQAHPVPGFYRTEGPEAPPLLKVPSGSAPGDKTR